MRGRRARLVAAAAAALAAAAGLAGCGGSGQVAVSSLAAHQQRYAGEQVTTSGTVVEQHDPNGTAYFVLSDGRGDLVGLQPPTTARRYRGQHVVVSGRFSIERGFGRVIRIDTIARHG